MIIPGNRILIEPTEPITKLSSGLFLPETAVQKPNTGRVILVGTKADPSLLNKTIIYNSLTSVEIDGKHLIHVTEIRFILE